MEHFYQNIQGWFNYTGLYSNAVRNGSDGCHFVEVGAWKGKSTSFMAVEIINSGKNIKFDVVDTWMGSEEHQLGGKYQDRHVINGVLYEHFINNLSPVSGFYNAIRMPSLQAAQQYQDGTLDFVMLDASHDYANVKSDILAWLPKIKSGGTLAGDDYAVNWPGVIQAVGECLPRHAVSGDTWIYRKQDTI